MTTYKESGVDIDLANKSIISLSSKFQNIEREIKFFLRVKMYNNKNVLKKNDKGKAIIRKLFSNLSKNPKKYLNNNQLKNNKYRAIADYISGMTDRFAIDLFNKI